MCRVPEISAEQRLGRETSPTAEVPKTRRPIQRKQTTATTGITPGSGTHRCQHVVGARAV